MANLKPETKQKKFKALFPLKTKITKETIDEVLKNGNLWSTGKCIGALTLKKALGKNVSLLDNPNDIWGLSNGTMSVGGVDITLTTKSGKNMIDVRTPRQCTFILAK